VSTPAHPFCSSRSSFVPPPIEVSVQPFDASTITLPAGSWPIAS